MRGSFSKEVPSELRDKGLGLGEPGVSGLGMEWPKAVRIGPVCVCARMRAKSLQSCPALRDPRDHGPPGSSVHGTPQTRILERVATALSRGSSQLRDGSTSLMPPALAGRLLSTSATWEARIGPKSHKNYHQPRTGCPGPGAHPVPSAVVRGHVASSSSGGVADPPAIPTKKQQFYCENPPRA